MTADLPMPPGFPLPAFDALGQALAAGDLVTIVTIPEWLTHDLAEKEVAALLALRGTNRAILRFDEYGYVWFGDGDTQDWFCLRPEEVKRCAH
jgi:hypothetical protein